MAWVKIRVPRTSQPQDACGIDRANAFGENVVFASPDGLSSQDRVATRIGAVTKKPTVNGTAAEFNGTSWVEYGTKPIIQPNSAFTISLYEETAAVGTFSSLFSIPVGSNQFIFIRGTAVEYRCSVGIAGGSGGYLFAGAGSQTAGEKIRFVITGSNISDRTTYKLWANGVKHTGIATTFGSLAAQSIKIGWDGADTKFNGLIQDVLFLDREVSDAEALAITDNPWQIFEPEELTIWIPDDAGTSGADNLTAKDITLGAVTVSKPSVGQSHVLSGKSLNLLATDVTSPTIYQVHQLSGKSVSTDALTISKPVLVYVPVTVHLVGRDISLGASTISSPALGQIHALTGSNLALLSVILTKPVISQVHGLNAQGVSLGEVTVTKPELASASNTDNLTAKSITLEALQVTKPSIEQIHVLAGLDVSLDELSITNSIIGQVHVLQVQPVTLAQAVISKPELTSLANTDVLYPKDITLSALTVSNPAITQLHALLGKSLVTGSVSIVKPLLGQVHGLSPKGINLGSWNITKPILIIGGTTEVYIDEILSDVVDDKVIVLLQDEVIQVNILSETI